MYCITRKVNDFTRKVNFLRVMISVLRVKHWINDPFGHKLQITLINLTTFHALNKWFYS